MFLMQKMLELSMQMDKSVHAVIRFLGKILGIIPVWYSDRMEKKLFDGSWDPVKKYRKRYERKLKRMHRKKRRVKRKKKG